MSKSEENDKSRSLKGKTNVKKTLIQPSSVQKLSNLRIIQKHLVYVIGLSSTLANKETLGKYEYFGQYGSITKIVVNKTKAYNPNGPNGPSYSAYISYANYQEASIAILAIDNIEVDDHILRASYGTTKYCTFFLKNLDCPNKECLYLHYLSEDSDIINRDDMNSNTNIFYEQQLLAMKLADIFNSEIKKKIKSVNKKKCIFPASETIYTKDIVVEQEQSFKYYGYNTNGNKFKKQFNDEYCNYYKKYDNYNDFYGNDEEDKETSNELVREKSDNLLSVKYISEKISNIKEGNKFISKSKSPITNKKKFVSDKSSLSPNKKLNIEFELIKKEEKIENEDLKDMNKKILENNLSPLTQKKLYCIREKSRFDFVRDENCVSSYEIKNLVPEFVCNVINKKFSRHSFFKKFVSEFEKKNINDCIYFEKELKKNDSWAEFILLNMETK